MAVEKLMPSKDIQFVLPVAQANTLPSVPILSSPKASGLVTVGMINAEEGCEPTGRVNIALVPSELDPAGAMGPPATRPLLNAQIPLHLSYILDWNMEIRKLSSHFAVSVLSKLEV